MQIDTLTLMVTGSFVAACAGATLLFAWWANRGAVALAMWGLAGLAAAAGICSLIMATVYQEPAFFVGAAYLLVLNDGLIWKGARTLDAKPAPIAGLLSGLALFFFIGMFSPQNAGPSSLAISAAYLFGAAVSLWQSRAERLPARRPLIVLITIHAAVTLVGAFSRIGTVGTVIEPPPLMSFFGVIHFESIIFAVGTAAFVLLLVKERSEAASHLAATVDSLTGIANRAAFMQAATAIMDRCRREDAPVSVIMFDLDKFKGINDTYGHATGDAVIQKFCAVAAAALRPIDAFGRLGGEEFAIVLASSSIESAFVRAERIRAAFEENCRIVGDKHVNATVSTGVSVSLNGDTAIGALLKLSDAALYAAKASGRNRVKRADQIDSKIGHSTLIRVA
jgi:diguanylate cyclase (GGDEF)-like protein